MRLIKRSICWNVWGGRERFGHSECKKQQQQLSAGCRRRDEEEEVEEKKVKWY